MSSNATGLIVDTGTWDGFVRDGKLSSINAWEYYFGASAVPKSSPDAQKHSDKLLEEFLRDALLVGAIMVPLGVIVDEIRVKVAPDPGRTIYDNVTLEAAHDGEVIWAETKSYFLGSYVYGTMRMSALTQVLEMLRQHLSEIRL